MLECEEQNIHYRIFSVEGEYVEYNYLKDRIILPVFDKKNSALENDSLFFPSPALRRKMYLVKGFYSKRPTNSIENLNSCIGAHKFRISEIIKEIDVTEKFDYPIDNR